jgi:putative methionine-R-sulfoxide reductase with GAF domain
VTAGAIDEIERLLSETQEADDVLRGTVAALIAEPGIVWAGVGFVEKGAVALGPASGEPDEERRTSVPIRYEDTVVGELWADGDVELRLLEEIARRIAPHVLIGWDTRGEPWEP